MYDVMVIGAGPAGSLVAQRLAGRGHQVVVLEEHPHIGEPMCCTGIVGRECLDVFPLPPHLIWSPVSAARFYTPSGQSFELKTEPTPAYIVDRAALDRTLAHQAQQAGAEYILSTPVRDMRLQEDRVIAEAGREGKAFLFAARAAVLACGPASTLPQKLGLGEIGDWVLGAQAEVEMNGRTEVEIYMGQKVSPGFFAWLVPTTPGRAWAGLLCRGHPSTYLNPFLARLQEEGKIHSSSPPITYGRVPLHPPQRTYGERVLAVGDAAGQVKPTTGGGIYYGLLGAEMAAEVLHHALETDNLSPGFLSRYQRQWKKRLGRELQMGSWAHRFYEKLGDRQLEDIVHHLRTSGVFETLLQSPDFSYDWHAPTIVQALGRHTLPLFLRALASAVLPPSGGNQHQA